VLSPSGAAVAGATVTAGGLRAVSGTGGAYSINNLPAGAVTITASLTGFQSASTSVTVVAATTTSAPPIKLASSSGTITGVVKSSSGAAISGASVSYGGGNTTRDASGAFTLTSVPAGTVQLVASATGFQTVTQNVTVTGGATSTANFTLTAQGTTGTVTGKVTNISNGAALSGATVSWSGGSTTTNASGIYTFTNVPTGGRNFTASKTGYLNRTLGTTVNANATSTLNIPISVAGHITAKVLSPSGAAVAGATVTIKGGGIATTVTGTTGTTGLFTTPWIPVGTYTVTITKTGHATQTKTGTLSSGVTTTITFTGF